MSYDSEYDSENDLDDAFGSFLMAAVHSQGEELRATRQTMVTALGATELVTSGPSPHELWKTFLSNLSSGESKVLKITDACFEKYGHTDAAMTTEVVTVVQSNPGLAHVILEDKLLRHVQQVALFQAISVHCATLTYVKLVPGERALAVTDVVDRYSSDRARTAQYCTAGCVLFTNFWLPAHYDKSMCLESQWSQKPWTHCFEA